MRIFPIITAILVSVALYFLVFERDRVIAFATGKSGGETAQAQISDSTDQTTGTSQPSENGQEDAHVISVVAMHSLAQPLTNAVLVRGRTEAARQVQVRSETSGRVISDPLRKGADVVQGQELCKLDPGTREVKLQDAMARLAEAQARIPAAQARLPEAKAALAGAQARLKEAEINLRGAERLSKGGFASDTRVASAQAAYESAAAAVESAKAAVESALSGVETARAGVQSAQAGVAAAEREIAKLTITAPFGGLLESDTAETGSLLQPGALCATIIQLDPIKLVGFVPETEVARVRVGAQAGARLTSGDKVAGKVTFLSRAADPITRTFRVEVLVPNPGRAIRDGQTAEIVIASNGTQAHLLPLSSLTLNDDGVAGVRTVTADSKVKFMPVTVIRDSIDGIWVSGLPQNVDIIYVGQDYVSDGVMVDVTFREPGT